jgi:hypothetical protein
VFVLGALETRRVEMTKKPLGYEKPEAVKAKETAACSTQSKK